MSTESVQVVIPPSTPVAAGADAAGVSGVPAASRRRAVRGRQVWSLQCASLPTPIGRLQILWDRDGVLCGVDWEDGQGPDGRGRLQRLLRSQNRVADIARVRASSQHPAVGALTAYFAGDLAAIDPLRAAPAGTAFQQRVWQALREIPAGTTVSYAALAARIGHPTAIRAVGAANGANPVSIIIPCHRLVGSDRSLTGYAGGVARKAWLLSHEGATGG